MNPAIPTPSSHQQRRGKDTPNSPRAAWRKSSRSGQNGNCAEVAVLAAKVRVRDSKAPDAGHLSFNPQTWTVFVSDVRNGRYDLP
ncbi:MULTISPECIES: DUF397 domain-containing protein [Actinomadura]|jgi:hypothetical protein|uniref:DUF397 domain-containing protein n=1 Tax=Actinomadura geliboluensis TaxID=882440 RepID=A0A5S4GTT6_9ACTN|nr:DUF397 domain-containing protein [Actinomadura geliboluensis]TMR35921.1 DUF397 domain-containing protein [Actinomadura geliboluensis]